MGPNEKVQHCDYCGDEVGVFAHSRMLDGPIICGKKECLQDADAEARTQAEEARHRAEEDDYYRYRQ